MVTLHRRGCGYQLILSTHLIIFLVVIILGQIRPNAISFKAVRKVWCRVNLHTQVPRGFNRRLSGFSDDSQDGCIRRQYFLLFFAALSSFRLAPSLPVE